MFINNLPNAFPNIQQNTISINNPVVISTNTSKSPFKPKKAGTKGFHCFLILDESGSMASLKNDTIGGVNSYIQKQKEDNDGTKLSIIKFEGGNIRVPVSGLDVKEVGNFTDYQPCGSTNLLDAIGNVMNEINKILEKGKKKDRPSIFIQIITDGAENSSRNYNKNEIKDMISKATEADWIITYVGANVDSFGEASSIGISVAATSNYNTNNTLETYQVLSESVSRMKSARSLGMTAVNMYSSGVVYTNEDKEKMGE